MRHIPTTSSQDDAVSIVRRSPADDMTHAAAGSPPVVDAPPSGGTIRKLWSIEADRFRDHLLRLDTTSRRMRFAHAVSDGFIEEYASRMGANGRADGTRHPISAQSRRSPSRHDVLVR